MEDRLAKALALVPGYAGETVTPIAGGITNRSYRVTVGGQPCVLRLDGKSAGVLGIDRHHELVALRAMAAAGIGADVVFADEASGVLVTRVVAGRPLEPADLVVSGCSERVARLVRRVHDGAPFPGVFSPFAVVRDYLAKAAALGSEVAGANQAVATMASVEQSLGDPGPLRPCHNDLLAGNLVIDGDRLHIIDWEYAAMGDPLFDVANFVGNAELSESAAAAFFDAYWGRPSSEHERAHLVLLRFMSDLREAAWGVLQAAQSDIDFDFRSYAAKHLERAMAHAGSARFSAALRCVRGQAGS